MEVRAFLRLCRDVLCRVSGRTVPRDVCVQILGTWDSVRVRGIKVARSSGILEMERLSWIIQWDQCRPRVLRCRRRGKTAPEPCAGVGVGGTRMGTGNFGGGGRATSPGLWEESRGW